MSSIRISSSSSSLAAAAVKKAQPIAWSHQETLNLIEAYKEKWYSVERGPLKGSQWEEVAVTVSLRCGYEDAHPSEKRGIQCRHKMEKLRKRYRAEKKTGRKSCWVYYDVMECLERGPMPVSARPLTENLEEDEEEEEEEEDEEDEEEEEEEDEEEEMGVRVAAEIREFARRLVRMEKRKMNMMRQSQTWRVQMENKRIQMILDSHTKIIDIIATTFAPPPPH